MQRLLLPHVHRFAVLLFASLFTLPATHAEVCDPNALEGAYGFSLTGNTTIGGATRPVAVVGRLDFAESGNLGGVSSVAFTGLILGNPVTGKYEAKTDCSVTWSLQDDSGNLQHFDGTMSSDGHVTFRQSDAGGAENGSLRRAPSACSESTLAGSFGFSLSGSTVDVYTAVSTDRVSLSGLLEADGAGGLSFAAGPDEPPSSAGTYDVQDDCFVEIAMELPTAGDTTAMMHFRAILVEDGHEVLGIQTDPGTVVALRLISR